MPDKEENTSPVTSPEKNRIVIPVSPDVQKELRKMSDEELRNYFLPKIRAIYDQGLTLSGRYITKDKDFEEKITPIWKQLIEQVLNEEAIQMSNSSENYSSETEISPPSKEAISQPSSTADPINLFNGKFAYSTTDLTINGAGIDFSFTRNYSQLTYYNNVLGHKWDHNYNLWLRLSGDNNVIFRSNGALAEISYRRHTTRDYFFSDFGESGIIIERNGKFIWRSEEGIEFIYADNLSGRSDIMLIDRVEDRFGNFLQFHYRNNLLIRVEVNHPSRLVFFHYDNNNRINAINDFTERTWKYSYDVFGDLVAVTTPSTTEFPSGLTTYYEYSTFQFSAIILQHNLLRILDASGQIFLENEYGTEPNLLNFNRVIRQRQGSGETYLEYEDVIEEFIFPYPSHQIPAHQTVETQRNGQQIRYLFNRFGNMVFREEYARINGVPKLISSHYRYNKDGNLVGMISPSGIITQFLYGRDYYEKKQQIDDDYISIADANLTSQVRQSFNRLLTSVIRGKYYNINSLNVRNGLWSDDIFPDIFDVTEEDVIQKYEYEPEFGQLLTISDPRHTKMSNPDAQEDRNYFEHLTTYQYKTQNNSSHFLLDRITTPSATAPDGSIIGSAIIRYLNYDGNGRLNKFENAANLITEFEYFSDGTIEGMLKKTTLDPLGLNIQCSVERDELGRAIKTFEPRHFEAQDDRFVSEIKINNLGQVTETISTKPYSVKTQIKYDRTGNIKESLLEVKDSSNSFVDNLFYKKQYFYDQEFRLVKIKEGDQADSVFRLQKTVYDSTNRPIITISSTGRKTKIIYNERSLPQKEIKDYGGSNINTRNFYDAEGRLVRMSDARGGMHRIVHDPLGRIIEITNSEGNITCISYDKLGNKLTERFFEKFEDSQFVLKARSEFYYDELGRLIKQGLNLFENHNEIVNNPSASYIDNGPGRLLITTFFYDKGGRIIKTIDQSNRAFIKEYDILGRVIKQADFLGNEISYQYDSANNVIRTDRKELIRDTNNIITGNRYFANQNVHDEYNRVIETIDTLGNKTHYQYDTRGLLTKNINALNHVHDNEYDVFGRLLKTTQHLALQDNPDSGTPVNTSYQYNLDDLMVKQIDALGRETSFIYNSLGQLVSTILPDLSADLYEYDFSGMLKSYRDRNGLVSNYIRDVLGRIIRNQISVEHVTNGVIIEGETFSEFSYDSLSRTVKSENDFTSCVYSYNSLGWLLEERTTAKPFMSGILTQPLNIKREYNDNAALINLIYPSGRHLRYHRDLLDRLVTIEQIASGTNFPGNINTPENYTIASFEYSGLQRKTIKRFNQAVTHFSHDFGGRIVDIDHKLNGSNLLQIQLLYDAIGNLKLKTENADDFQSKNGFDYDELNRLNKVRKNNLAIIQDLSVIAPFSSQLPDNIPNNQSIINSLVLSVPELEKEYELDLVGNRTRVKEVGLTDIIYASTPHDMSLDQYSNVNGTSFKYDKNGNLIDDGQLEYRYNFNNQLTSAHRKSNGTQILSFIYDTLGRKVIQIFDNLIRQSVYISTNSIEEYENQILKSSIVLDNGIDNYLQINTKGKDLYLLSDLVKSTRYILNENQKESFYSYDEFGEITLHNQASSANQYLFQGKRWISEIAKYDFFTRFYDPKLGRFQQRDAKGYVDGTNLYAFVNNNPTSNIDPFGTERKELLIGKEIGANEYGGTLDINDPNFGEDAISKFYFDENGTFLRWSENTATWWEDHTGTIFVFGKSPEPTLSWGKRFINGFTNGVLAIPKAGVNAIAQVIDMATLANAVRFKAMFGIEIPYTSFSSTSKAYLAGVAQKQLIWDATGGLIVNPALAIGDAIVYQDPEIIGEVVSGIAVGSYFKYRKGNSVTAHSTEKSGFANVLSKSKITTNLEEIQLYEVSLMKGWEFARIKRNGKWWDRTDMHPTEVRFPDPQTITEAIHTHPISGIAKPSVDDIRIKANFPKGTTHSVLGRAFPEADKLLREFGLPESGKVMKTTY